MKQGFLALGFWIFLSISPCVPAQAVIAGQFIPPNALITLVSPGKMLGHEAAGTFSIKNESKIYDEKKDPALRKGTENWEEPQSSFFIIPALILGIAAIALFFSQK